ncbi:20657_t:CDS:2, partial [Gigaspora rosea]
MEDMERLVSLVGMMVRLIAATVKKLKLEWKKKDIKCQNNCEENQRSKTEGWKLTNLDDGDVNIRFLRIMEEDNNDTKRNVN